MPIYEYRCDEGHTFEAMQSFSDEALTSCKLCGAPVRRLLSAPAIHFKGSGFYTTDYGSKSKSRAAGSADSGSSEANGSSSGTDGGSSTSSTEKSGESAKPAAA